MKQIPVLLAAALLFSVFSGCGIHAPQSSAQSDSIPVAVESDIRTAASGAAPQETQVSLAEQPEVIPTEPVAPTEKLEGCSLFVKAVEGLPEDFILGMDASQVPSLEASGVKYYDAEGQEQDVFRILAENGVNYIRVRVWNDPFDADGHGYGGGNCTIDTALEIGRRATRYGMKLLVDFHYSDFWADPSKQMAPKAWKNMDLETKTAALEIYTHDCLALLRNAGVDVGMVQVGNETNGAMCGETSWSAITKLMAAGSRAVRQVFPEALVAVHFANPEGGAYPAYASNLQVYELDYDVFGTSYYPFWHGSLDNLTDVLRRIGTKYDKKVMVMETSYAWTLEDTDFSGNTISADSSVDKPYPYSPQGQVNSLRDVTQAVFDAGGIGICYWEGTWVSVGTVSKSENQKLWEQYGSGWASSYAAEYDPDDAGRWYGGDAVDNQAFFDAHGHVMESLMAFNLIRFGNGDAVKVEEIPDVEYIAEVGDAAALPETVTAIMNDGTRQELAVQWEIAPEELEAALAQPGTRTVTGTAGERTVRLKLTVRQVNLLQNPGFEDGADAPWVAENLGGGKELKLENKPSDSKSGDWHYHFWSPEANTTEFTLEQNPENLTPGTYAFSISVMGGDCGQTEVYAYAKLDGEMIATALMEITAWNEWHTGTVSDIQVGEGQTLTVGIYVKADGAGAWGKIDDAALYRLMND